ncbi:integrase-like protein [Pseudoroseicyclus aestuarii]|uniref:Integrase-like protein n=1 Tax=Pseudoroseicyclus aestuarii TaxID=1795041 RepID=A0A318SLM2_9RHOB|nr:integrase-like protein [Pseudoroseicyclus aestuarii]
MPHWSWMRFWQPSGAATPTPCCIIRTRARQTSEQFQRLLFDNGITCSMSSVGNVWDNSAMESFFSSPKTERTAPKTYHTRDAARADVFDYIERFYNPRRRHSKLGHLSPTAFEARVVQT